MKHVKIILLSAFLYMTTILSAQNSSIEQNREVNYYLIEAKSALVNGNVQKAISLYNQCIAKNKKCATAHYELANIAIAVKDTEAALQHSRNAVKIAPKNAWYQLQLANILEARGMLKQAAESYFKLAKLEEENPFYLQKSIMLFERLEDWNKALEVYTALQKQQGNDFNLLVRKQSLYSKAGKQKEGLLELKKMLKDNPTNSEYYALLAMRYEEIGDTKKVAKTFKKMASLDSIGGVAQMMLCRYYMEQKSYKKAFESLKSSIKSGQVDERANIEEVIKLLQADTTENVIQYRKILSQLLIEQYPQNAIGYLFKAREYGEKEEYDKAKEVLKKALEIDPTNYNGLLQSALIQNIEKNWEGLYHTAEKAIKLYPQEHFFYLFKGVSASQQKKYKVAELALTTGYLYAKEDKDKNSIQELLADVYYKNGNVEKAFDLFEQMVIQNPENISVLNNYAYFLALENRELEKAEKMSKKTVEKEPESATFLDTYAWVLYIQKKYAVALEYMQKAINSLKEEKDGSAEMWEHYGDILLKMGKKKEAVKSWKKALLLPEPETERLEQKIKENKELKK